MDPRLDSNNDYFLATTKKLKRKKTKKLIGPQKKDKEKIRDPKEVRKETEQQLEENIRNLEKAMDDAIDKEEEQKGCFFRIINSFPTGCCLPLLACGTRYIGPVISTTASVLSKPLSVVASISEGLSKSAALPIGIMIGWEEYTNKPTVSVPELVVASAAWGIAATFAVAGQWYLSGRRAWHGHQKEASDQTLTHHTLLESDGHNEYEVDEADGSFRENRVNSDDSTTALLPTRINSPTPPPSNFLNPAVSFTVDSEDGKDENYIDNHHYLLSSSLYDTPPVRSYSMAVFIAAIMATEFWDTFLTGFDVMNRELLEGSLAGLALAILYVTKEMHTDVPALFHEFLNAHPQKQEVPSDDEAIHPSKYAVLSEQPILRPYYKLVSFLVNTIRELTPMSLGGLHSYSAYGFLNKMFSPEWMANNIPNSYAQYAFTAAKYTLVLWTYSASAFTGIQFDNNKLADNANSLRESVRQHRISKMKKYIEDHLTAKDEKDKVVDLQKNLEDPHFVFTRTGRWCQSENPLVRLSGNIFDQEGKVDKTPAMVRSRFWLPRVIGCMISGESLREVTHAFAKLLKLDENKERMLLKCLGGVGNFVGYYALVNRALRDYICNDDSDPNSHNGFLVRRLATLTGADPVNVYNDGFVYAAYLLPLVVGLIGTLARLKSYKDAVKEINTRHNQLHEARIKINISAEPELYTVKEEKDEEVQVPLEEDARPNSNLMEETAEEPYHYQSLPTNSKQSGFGSSFFSLFTCCLRKNKRTEEEYVPQNLSDQGNGVRRLSSSES